MPSAMATLGSTPDDPVAWARRVNHRWIVHHGLEENAEAYLNHLQAMDAERLLQSCRRAHRMVHECGMTEDPKPWFYAGLFSLATPPEAATFLKGHWFTAACILSAPAEPGREPVKLDEQTLAKLRRIREALKG